MKRKDIGLILVITIISGFISLLISNTYLASPDDRKQLVEVVEPIDSSFQAPPKQYFNDKSLNPTRIIQIGEDPNSKPFGQ